MCEICLHSPCLSRCPNAPDPPTVWKCQNCGEPIMVGDEYTEIDGDHYHEECAKDNAAVETFAGFLICDDVAFVRTELIKGIQLTVEILLAGRYPGVVKSFVHDTLLWQKCPER